MIDVAEYRKRVIAMSTERGDFVMMEDGYYVYWPEGYTRGFVSAHELRILADHLDAMNAEWDAQVQQGLGGKS